MMVVRCPSCTATLRIRRGRVGKKARCGQCGHNFRIQIGVIPNRLNKKELAARKRMPHFKCDVPRKDGRCSDDNCPCQEVTIPRGTGYLYIDEDLIRRRKYYPKLSDAKKATERNLRESFPELGPGCFFMGFRLGPILMCAEGAHLRKVDLVVAAADARYWWKKGLVALRPTPLAGTPEARRERKRLGLPLSTLRTTPATEEPVIEEPMTVSDVLASLDKLLVKMETEHDTVSRYLLDQSLDELQAVLDGIDDEGLPFSSDVKSAKRRLAGMKKVLDQERRPDFFGNWG